ncbi:MAG: ribonuclease D [Acidimicrobiales bacterium]
MTGAAREASQPAWIDTQEGLAGLVGTLLSEEAYGLDTEFHRERTYWPRLALVQLSWSGGVALIDPLALDLSPLSRLFGGGGLVVAHAADQDLEVLERAAGSVPSRLFDTQVAAGFVGMSSPSLQSLVERFCGTRLAKGDRLTDWMARPLTAEQRSYAASDVEHLLDLHAALAADLRSRGRLGWAEAECELLRCRARRPSPPEEIWWRMKEARSLRGRARGVAQELAAWRDRRAAELDRPARFVLPDLALAAMTQRPPQRESDLESVRGLQGRLPARTASEVMEAVRAGLALDESRLRLPPSDGIDRRQRPAATLASAWLAQRAAELELDPALLATRADLSSLLGGDSNGRLSAGWRKEVLGGALADVVAGRVALVLDGKGGLMLEARSYRPPDPAGA